MILINRANATDYYVAPNGTADAPGTLAAPWSIERAFQGNSTPGPGDKVWLRGGTYAGAYLVNRQGTSNSPIVFRGYQNERAIIDGQLDLAGSTYVWFWGLEIIDSLKSTRPDPFGTVNNGSVGTRFINCLIHDACICLGGGPYEAYGNILWNCGKSSREHGIYWQNDYLSSGITKIIQDNIIFNSSGFGIHSYSSAGKLNGFQFDGNVLWRNGALLQDKKDDILLGGGQPVDHAEITKNLLFGEDRGIRVGWSYEPNTSVRIEDNYIAIGSSPFIIAKAFNNLLFQRNTIIQGSGALVTTYSAPGTYTINNNSYYTSGGTSAFILNNVSKTLSEWRAAGYDANSSNSNNSRPSQNAIFIKANKYESSRFDVVIYNWQNLTSVNVDLSNYLSIGKHYEIRKAENYFSPLIPDLSYSGGLVLFPMTNTTVATPIGSFVTPPSTFPDFGAFIVREINASTVSPPAAPSNLRVPPAAP